MSTNCNCQNPKSGGTKCPPQHIALCIRGVDRECYGECIPIPREYRQVSENFTYWMQNEVNQKVQEHISDNSNLYRQLSNFNETLHSLEKENYLDKLPKGFSKFRNSNDDEISVQYSFSFEDTIDPLDSGQMLQMQ